MRLRGGMKNARCPACLKRLDAATSLSSATPAPGSVSVCAYCATYVVFQTDMTLRQARPEDLEYLSLTAAIELALYVQMIHRLHAAGDRIIGAKPHGPTAE